MLSFVPVCLPLSQEGLYRIVAKVNGTSSGANTDHLALYVNNQQVSRSMVGLNTGYQIASHINEVVAFKAGNTFSVCSSYHIFSFVCFLTVFAVRQIYQQFDSYNLLNAHDNRLYVELLD